MMSGADGLERVAPRNATIDSGRVLRFLDDVESAGLELHDFLLWRGGTIVASGWKWPYGPDRFRMTHSVTKSFTASAIGLLIEEGRLTLSDPVAGFFPEVELAPDSPHRRMTVEDLLTMRTGHADEVSGSVWRGIKTSWVAEFFRIPIAHEPGSRFVYSSAASYMLSAIVTRVTGELLADYLRPRLFEPLGVADYRWDVGPDGVNPGGNGLTMTTPDCMKLGILHAQGGVWGGQRILPSRWVEAATRSQGDPTYGYHWVVAPNYYAALGQFVQLCAVFADHDAVLMINAAIDGSRLIKPHIERHFPAAFGSPGSDGDAAFLERRLLSWSETPRLESAGRIDAEALDGRWTTAPNPTGLTGLSLDLAGDRLSLVLTDGEGDHRIDAVEGGWLEAPVSLPAPSLHHGYALAQTPTLSGFRALGADSVELVLHFVETCFRDTITIAREGDALRLDRSVNINSGDRAWPTIRLTRD
jgi:CubicO group peptidase (beta-lactamase class C family)